MRRAAVWVRPAEAPMTVTVALLGAADEAAVYWIEGGGGNL